MSLVSFLYLKTRLAEVTPSLLLGVTIGHLNLNKIYSSVSYCEHTKFMAGTLVFALANIITA